MKRVLLSGKTGYLTTKLSDCLIHQPELYELEIIDLRDKMWRERSFAGNEVLFHGAGLCHRKADAAEHDLVNCQLALEVAHKAKAEGVRYFIFMSSVGIYGMNIGEIQSETPVDPKSCYAKAKHRAEQALLKLESDAFKVALVRAPMVYGEGCKGNFARLKDLIKWTPVFPKTSNQRSMIYIDNLTASLKYLIDQEIAGLHHPQDSDGISTQEIVEAMAASLDKKILFIPAVGKILSSLPFETTQKVFGSLIINQELSSIFKQVEQVPTLEALQRSTLHRGRFL